MVMKYRSAKKPSAIKRAKPYLDGVAAWSALNAGAIYEILDFADTSTLSEPTKALAVMGAGAGLVGANYLAFRSKPGKRLRKAVAKASRAMEKRRYTSIGKTAALLGLLGFAGYGLQPYASQVCDDLSRYTKSESETEATTPLPTPENIGKLYDRLGYEPRVVNDFTGAELASKCSKVGRLQRTLRWQPIYRAVESAYGIPEDTLGGMIMQESCGDPMQPNSSGDGGLGVVHIQGTSAKEWGLDIYGDSNHSSDKSHGRQISRMLEDCGFDPACAQEFDDRAHLVKALDTAARIVTKGRKIHGSWDYGIEYFRAPGKVGRSTTWKYLNSVQHHRSRLRDRRALLQAAKDFENRNGYSFDDYLEGFHEMSNNWGLETYNATMESMGK